MADVRTAKSRVTQTVTCLAVRTWVAQSAAKGLDATERQLRDRADEFGLTDKSMRVLVQDALRDGWLLQDKTHRTQGGGFPLLPGCLPVSGPENRSGTEVGPG